MIGRIIDLKAVFDAHNLVAEAWKANGFGAVTRIDMDKIVPEKLDVDIRRYAIPGVCNPQLAHRAAPGNYDFKEEAE